MTGRHIEMLRPVAAGEGRRAVANRSRLLPLAWAGIVGPVLFTGSFLAQEAFRAAEYSPLAEPVSALEAGPNGWVQQANFVVFAVLTVAFAVGLWQAVRPGWATRIGSVVIGLSGVGALLAALFPLREDAAGATYDPGGHIVGGMTFFIGSAVGLIVLSVALARDARWSGLASYTGVAGALTLLSLPVNVFLVMPDDAPLHDWAGLVQRIVVLVVLFPCRTLLAVRMLRVARGQR